MKSKRKTKRKCKWMSVLRMMDGDALNFYAQSIFYQIFNKNFIFWLVSLTKKLRIFFSTDGFISYEPSTFTTMPYRPILAYECIVTKIYLIILNSHWPPNLSFSDDFVKVSCLVEFDVDPLFFRSLRLTRQKSMSMSMYNLRAHIHFHIHQINTKYYRTFFIFNMIL